jgi:hypothetical protein
MSSSLTFTKKKCDPRRKGGTNALISDPISFTKKCLISFALEMACNVVLTIKNFRRNTFTQTKLSLPLSKNSTVSFTNSNSLV